MNPYACDKLKKCQEILHKICVPFYCFDDNFLQFYSDSTIATNVSLSKGNFANFTYNVNITQNNSIFIQINQNFSQYSQFSNYTNYSDILVSSYISVSNSNVISYRNLGNEIEDQLSPLNFSNSLKHHILTFTLVLSVIMLL
jgi:hypothetical protein